MHHVSPRKIMRDLSPSPPLDQIIQSEHAPPGSPKTFRRAQSGPGWYGPRLQTAKSSADTQKRSPALTYAKMLSLTDLQCDSLHPVSSIIDSTASKLQQTTESDSYFSTHADSTQKISSRWTQQDRTWLRPAKVSENKTKCGEKHGTWPS